jgi:hypothetical protein
MPSSKQRVSDSQKKRESRLAMHKRLMKIHAEITALRRERAIVNRDEFEEMTKSLRQIEKNTYDIATQFTRIAQMQAELDSIKRALKKATLLG